MAKEANMPAEKYTDRSRTGKCTAGQPDTCDCGQSGFIYLYDG